MKKPIIIILVSVLLPIVSSITLLAGSEAEDPKMLAQRQKEMTEAALNAADAFNENDLEKYMSFFTDDFIKENISKSPGDKDAFRTSVARFFTKFPGIRNYQKDLLPFKNYLVFDECTFEIPIPENDKTISIFHMDIIEMEGDKMKVKRTFGDGATMKVALGFIEPPIPLPQPPVATTLAVPKPTGLTPLWAQEQFQVLWNKHDLSSIAEMTHANAEILVSPLLAPVDRNGYIGWLELFFTAFPDIRMTRVHSYGGSDWAFSEVKLTGTNSGPYIGHPSTGKRIELGAGYLTRFDANGLITSFKLYVDSMVIMKQLGFKPIEISAKQ